MIALQILQDSFSIVGTKELAFQTHRDKFIYFSDTGGILGQPIERNLSFKSFCNKSILSLHPEQAVFGRTELAPGKDIVFSSGLDFLDAVLRFSDSSHHPDMWLPAKLGRAKPSEFLGDTSTRDSPLWEPLLAGGFLPLRLETDKDRVKVHVPENAPVEFPISAASFSLNDSTLQCHNRLLIGENRLDGFTIEFPTPETAARWLELVGVASVLSKGQGDAATEALVDLIGEVRIEGILNGHRLKRTAGDARIDGSIVQVLKRDGAEHLKFDFASSVLAIDGTAAEFVVSPNSSTAIIIASESKPFLRAVYTNTAANAAVIRSANDGPFIARDADGRFIRIETTKDGVAIGYDGGELSAVPAGVARPSLRKTDTKPVLDVADYTIEAELPTLEGICAAITGMSLQPTVSENFENAVAQILALEGKFLTVRVFGKIAAMHVILMNALNHDSQSNCSAVQRDDDKEAFLGFMAEVSRDLSLECETIMNYFAGYVIEQDRNFLSAAGMPNSINYTAAENAYQAAVNPAGALLSHFGRIESLTWQFQSSQEFATRDEGWAAWAPLGMSVVGTYFNPFLAVSAVQQGVALKRGKDAKLAVATESIQKLFAPCAREWDFIIRTLLPAVSNRFLKQIYPLRLAVAHTLRKAYATADENAKNMLTRLLADRIARLTTFLDFPISSEFDTKRHSYADFIWDMQSNADGMHDRRF